MIPPWWLVVHFSILVLLTFVAQRALWLQRRTLKLNATFIEKQKALCAKYDELEQRYIQVTSLVVAVATAPEPVAHPTIVAEARRILDEQQIKIETVVVDGERPTTLH